MTTTTQKPSTIFHNLDTSKIPNFDKMTLEEEAQFWDTHDTTDYIDTTLHPEVIPMLTKTKPDNSLKEVTIGFRTTPKMKAQFEKLARQYQLSVSALVRLWTLEKLEQLTPQC